MNNRVTRDEIDGGITNLVFAEGNRERPPWRCCSNTVVSRSEIIKFSAKTEGSLFTHRGPPSIDTQHSITTPAAQYEKTRKFITQSKRKN